MADFAPQTTYADLLKKLKTPQKPPLDYGTKPLSPGTDTSPNTLAPDTDLKKKKPISTLLNQL